MFKNTQNKVLLTASIFLAVAFTLIFINDVDIYEVHKNNNVHYLSSRYGSIKIDEQNRLIFQGNDVVLRITSETKVYKNNKLIYSSK